MKWHLLGLLLAWGGIANASDADKMAQFYSWHPTKVDIELVRYAGQETERFAKMLGLSPVHTRIMLCMWHRESGYDQFDDDGDSIGITQVRRRNFKRMRKFWRDRGVELGSIADPSTQVAFGVAMFKEHLGYARGDLYDAVRRYNGSGRMARLYADKVFTTRKVVYGDAKIKR